MTLKHNRTHSRRLSLAVAALVIGFGSLVAYADDTPTAAAPAASTAAAPAAADAGDPTQAPAIELAGTTAPDIVKGKRVFQVTANCARCHGWPGDGSTGRDPRSAGIPANLRESQLDTNTMIQIVSCGIPGSAMPYHDSQAYKDKRCYGTTAADYTADQAPQVGHFLGGQDIINVVGYVQQKIKGRGPITKAECEEYFKPGASGCAPFN